MTYALVDNDVDVSTLTPVEDKNLTLKEALQELQDGSILVLANFEQTSGVDTFVRLNLTLSKPVTEVTYSMKTPTWMRYPVTVNAFSLYNTSVYDENTYGTLALRVGDLIRYRKDGVLVAGTITGVFMDSNKVQYFTINGEEKPYMLVLVPEAVETDSNVAGNVRTIAPVADPTRDSHQVLVEDWQTKVWVLL